MARRRTEGEWPVPEGSEGRYAMDRRKLVRRLFDLGWVVVVGKKPIEDELTDEEVDEVTQPEVTVALVGFASFHGLEPNGWPGPDVERVLNAPRMCQLPDVMPVGERLCKWNLPENIVTWHATGTVPGVTMDDHKAAVHTAMGYWNAVCGIKLTYSDNPRTCNIIITSGQIDRAGGTLAWSELPCGNPRMVTQKYDSAESWCVDESPPPQRIDLVRVVAHEGAHAIGISHIASGNLLAPMYNPQIRRPQPGDIAEAVSRYGRRSPDLPSPPTVDTGKKTITIEVVGDITKVQVPGYRVTELRG